MVLIIQFFCHAKETFSKDQLIKIIMINVYIKPEVEKNDTTEMKIGTNEFCIG